MKYEDFNFTNEGLAIKKNYDLFVVREDQVN